MLVEFDKVKHLVCCMILLFISACSSGGSDSSAVNASLEELGRDLFFDKNLSQPAGQSCASCHDPGFGFADPDQSIATSEGVVAGLFGSRNTPTSAYAFLSPVFAYNHNPAVVEDPEERSYVGGQFWDGRKATLEEQAKDPFLNPVEMANPDKASVVNKVRTAAYAGKFSTVFGAGALDETNQAYEYIVSAIAEFERSEEMNPFSSKFDYYQQGLVQLSDAELRGLDLFKNKAKCASCHPLAQTLPDPGSTPSIFTNFRYFNIGVPANAGNPFYSQSSQVNPDGAAFVDLGLGGVRGEPAEDGKFKTPTLRNIAATAPYMHNGVFQTLEEVIEFYNLGPYDFGDGIPEVDRNISGDIGFLELTDGLNGATNEKADLLAFLLTLSDGYAPP